MIEPINHTGIPASPSSCTPTPKIPNGRSGFEDRRDISKTSSKYILDGNRIVFERYDRNGKFQGFLGTLIRSVKKHNRFTLLLTGTTISHFFNPKFTR
jgi:hypothetical protein